eukprot:Gb_21830 [translate_table: standard]
MLEAKISLECPETGGKPCTFFLHISSATSPRTTLTTVVQIAYFSWYASSIRGLQEVGELCLFSVFSGKTKFSVKYLCAVSTARA